MVLVIIEILFFAHSTIVFGVVGVFLMLASLLWAMIDRYPGETFFPTGNALAIPLLNLFLALIGAAIADRNSCPLSAEDEHLSPLRADDGQPARAIAGWRSARVCDRRSIFPRAWKEFRCRSCDQVERPAFSITSSTS